MSLLRVETKSGAHNTVVSRDGHKLSYNRGTWEFFDLKADPAEAHNLFVADKPGARQAAMKAEMDALEKRPDNVKGCFHPAGEVRAAASAATPQ